MGRGGYRPGAGRKPKKPPETVEVEQATAADLMPLDYMLMILRDPKADRLRRDRMAMAAAPYCHAKISERPVSMKVERAEAAKTAGQGTEWGDDLMSPVVRLDQHRAA